MEHKNCPICSKTFRPRESVQLLCSNACRLQWRIQQMQSAKVKLATKTWQKIKERRRQCSCGRAFLACGGSHPWERCSECRAKAAIESRTVHCEDCGASFLRNKSQRCVCTTCQARRTAESNRETKKRAKYKDRSRLRCATVERFRSQDVFDRDRWICRLCRRAVRAALNEPDEATVDHIVPLSRGGVHSMANCQTACRDCNTRKGAKLTCELPPTGGTSASTVFFV
jgi:5-methylcytosine-specific restriction endonuclease McrA